MRRLFGGLAEAVLGTVLLGGCGGAPAAPISPSPVVPPPPNTAPVIDGISVQGSRTGEPANFADVGESVAVLATVHDAETAADQLQYVWTASAGTILGMGASVAWQAPATASPLPADVTITLRVIERYGTGLSLQHEVTGTATLSLHDSAAEVAEMSQRFLIEFSDSSLTDIDHIMRNFSRTYCPVPDEVDKERADVVKNRLERKITDWQIKRATVVVQFGGRCPFPDPTRQKAGDACALVPSYWADVNLLTGEPSVVDGIDYVAAAYSPASRRWWLCASDYSAELILGAAWSAFKR